MTDQPVDGGAPEKVSGAPHREGPTSVVIAVGLLIVSAAFFVGGLRVPQPEGWHTAPGMLPVILGASLFIMAALLLLKALRAGAIQVRFSDEDANSSFTKVGMALAVIAIFYFGLLRLLPFEPAAFMFLFAMLRIFWAAGPLWRRLFVAAAIPLLITLSFQGVFGIPLPGQGNLVLLAQYLQVTR